MRARLALGQNRRGCWLNCDDLDRRILRLQILADAGDRTARADTCDKDIDLAVGILPDLRTGGLAVCLRICRIDKLSRDKAVRDLLRQLIRLGDGTLHSLGAFRQHQLRAICLHQLTALDAHRLRHDDDDAVSARGGDGCQTDTGVARGRLDDDRTRLQQAFFLGIVDHLLGDAVLDRSRRIEVFQLRQNAGIQILGLLYVGQFQQRGLADQLVCGCINLAHSMFLLNGRVVRFIFPFV